MDSKVLALNAVTAPPNDVPSFTAIKTAMQALPFELLQWENFERLCYRLAGKGANIESHSLYGRSGQAQKGIDIFARKRNGKYDTWQAKRYKKYTKTDLNKAVKLFSSQSWADKTEIFFIAIQCPVDDVKLQDAIEEKAIQLLKNGITLKVLGGNDLSNELRKYPDIVLEFFGRDCAKSFFGDTIDHCLLLRLDGYEVNKVRAQLHKVYQAGFELLDRIPVDAPTPLSDTPQTSISLLERFSPPDILVRENVITHISTKQLETASVTLPDQKTHENNPVSQGKIEESRQSEQYRRSPITNWLSESNNVAVIGNAGSGKSTVLRCLALDLLGDQRLFPAVAKKWGRHLPLFISFAKWVRLTETSAGAVGIKDLLRASWQQQLTVDLVNLIDQAIDESRVVLFVDGLDEWANEQAARTTLQTMLTIVDAHNIPIIVSARPRGLTKIGAIPDDWATGVLAPLSPQQQRDIANIWFSRNSATKKEDSSHDESIAWQTNRFFNELNKGRGLSPLAETPLLLLGLIALAVRRLVLPLNKIQALNQLTDLLLEVHPHSRATAAGDVISRFSIAASIDVRRDALAALAFEMRAEGGDAGYPLSGARKCIKKFLSDPEGYAYPINQALSVANEILAVNSETIGLLVEKSPDEIGFVHASLEEYMASIHIQGWPMQRILDFTRSKASTVRWRSVFGDLIATTRRRSEAEQIVTVINEHESDAVGALQRRLLLADVAFGGAEINRATALKLSERSLKIIASAGWPGERSAHLSSALEGIYNPMLGEEVSCCIAEWGVRKDEYLSEFYLMVSRWKPCDEQLSILKHGIIDENPRNRRSAAHHLAFTYRENIEVEQWLELLLRGDTDLGVVAVTLEALAIGWPKNNYLLKVLNDDNLTKDKTLRLSRIYCKIKLNQQNYDDLALLINLLNWHDGIDYLQRDWAGKCLAEGWANDINVIAVCLKSVRNTTDLDKIETHVAVDYLLSCQPNNSEISEWIISELKSDRSVMLNANRELSRVLPFAKENPKLHEQLVLYITSKQTEHSEYGFRTIYEQLRDVRVKSYLISRVKNSEGISTFWALAPLIQGWAVNEPEVISLINEVKFWNDERKSSLIALYPLIMDHEECKTELLRLINSRGSFRSDLILSAFSQLHIEQDDELVNLLVEHFLHEPESYTSGGHSLVRMFPKHTKVREYALNRMLDKRAPIALLAATYEYDPGIKKLLAERAGSLSIFLRQQIIEGAAGEFDRSETARKILKSCNLEVNGKLKVQGSIRYYQAIHSTGADRKAIINQLTGLATSVGYDQEDNRAAGFAGMLIYEATDKLELLKENGESLDISLGSYDGENQALLRLIAENWDSLSLNFHGTEISRLSGKNSDEEKFWSLISAHISANETLKKSFISYCEKSEQCLDIQPLRALAKELPKSDLLRQHCWRAVKINDHFKGAGTWSKCQSYFEAAYILRDQFEGEADTLSRLADTVIASEFRHGIAALSIYDPKNEILSKANESLKKAIKEDNYTALIILSSSEAHSKKFYELVKNMINRDNHSLWDFQDRMNFSIKARIVRDEEFAYLIKGALKANPTESEIASFSRLLASTGKIDEETQQHCQLLLNERIHSIGIPAHGFDSISDAIRPVTHSLLDVLVGPIS